MNQRLILTLTISILFISGWMWMGEKLGYTKPALKPKTTELATAEKDPAQAADLAAVAAAAETPAAADTMSDPVVEAIPVIEKRVDTLENDLMRVRFSNEGAIVTSAVLKTYYHDVKQDAQIELVFAQEHHPGQILLGDPKNPTSDSGWMYQVAAESNKLTFTGSKAGAQIIKTYTLNDHYLLRCEVSYSDGPSSDFILVVGEGLQPVSRGERLVPSLLSMGAINPRMMTISWSEKGKHKDKAVDKENSQMERKLEEDSTVEWAGIKDNYFASVFMPDEAVANFFFQVSSLYSGDDMVHLPVVALQGKNKLNGSFYMGPMEGEATKGADERLTNLITYGWAGKLSEALFAGLKLSHNLTGNWGWAIILLTLFIRTLMIPLTIPQVKSSIKMRKIAPKIEKLKQKFSGSDMETKQKLSQATFALYKEEGVNPFSSCLTALLQMPIFFAYFSLLRSSMSLRQADWLGWIGDLSASDPYFVLPIIMGISMFLSSLAMPMPSADPVQAKMMKVMPALFSLMFVFMPSGLILYMITSNVFSLSQTKFLEWRYGNK